MERELAALCREISALRGSINKLTRTLAALCIQVETVTETSVVLEETECDNPDYEEGDS